jgi:hypothetical protein
MPQPPALAQLSDATAVADARAGIICDRATIVCGVESFDNVVWDANQIGFIDRGSDLRLTEERIGGYGFV